MLDTSGLIYGEGLDGNAIAAWQGSPELLPSALASASGDAVGAALALLCGLHQVQTAVPDLLRLADDDGQAACAAAWALAQLDSEKALLAALESGGLDLREHVYQSLGGLAARGAGSEGLAASMRSRIELELKRVAEGKSSLAEHALRVLAVLGTDDHAKLVQRLIEQDPYADRFELQRQAKQVQSEGRDRDSIVKLCSPWTEQLADLLVQRPDETTEVDEQDIASTPEPEIFESVAESEEDPETALDASPIDWKTFAASPEAAAIEPDMRAVVLQLGPALEQLCVRVTGMALTALRAQQFASLMLQVLPQALPPQAVQAALCPEALNGFESIGRWLRGQGQGGQEIVDGIRQVRANLRAQIRQSGILGGPDYSDPPAGDVRTS